MRADICDPSDKKAVERFRTALQRMGAKLSDTGWAIGVDVYHIKIGDSGVVVFSDLWSIDIDGPDDLVQRILEEFRRDAV